MTQIVEFILQAAGVCERRSAIPACHRIDGHRVVANRARHRRAVRLPPRRVSFLRLNLAPLREVGLTETGMKLRLEGPDAGVVRIELHESVEAREGAAGIIESFLGRGHREQGVRIPRIEFESLVRQLHDELETLPCRFVHDAVASLG